MKRIRKDVLIEKKQIENTKNEKKILLNLEHPFLLGMSYVIQNDLRIYFFLDFIEGGNLYQNLFKVKRFPEQTVKFFAAQLVLAFGLLHDEMIVHRDLKPENVLLSSDGYIKLADFGLAKSLNKNKPLTYSFCGTTEYLAPEIIKDEGHSFTVDWWTLGVLIYELRTGRTPFLHKNTHQTTKLIKSGKIIFPDPIKHKIDMTEEMKDIITELLQKDPKKRLGCNAAHTASNNEFAEPQKVESESEPVDQSHPEAQDNLEENKIEEVIEEHNQLLTENMQETVQELTEIENKEIKDECNTAEEQQIAIDPEVETCQPIVPTEELKEECYQKELSENSKTCNDLHCIQDSNEPTETEKLQVDPVNEELIDNDEPIPTSDLEKEEMSIINNEMENANLILNNKTNSLIEMAIQLKNEGNDLFKNGELSKARSKYTRVFAYTKGLIGNGEPGSEGMVEMIQKGACRVDISQEIKDKARELERDVNSNMAMVYLKEQNYPKAIEKATKSIAIEKTSKAYFRRGKGYAMKNDFENAYKDFEEGKALEKDNPKLFDDEIEKTKKREKEYDKNASKAFAGFFDN